MIRNQGWFVSTLSALVSGEVPEMVNYNDWRLARIWNLLASLTEVGISKRSRRGWETINHPTLGTVQWRMGVSAFIGWYLFLRVNGQLVLAYQCKDRQGRRRPEWASAQCSAVEKDRVEHWLGDID